MESNNKLLKNEWEVRPVCYEFAKRFITRYHYARGGSNTAVYLHGLFRKGDIFDEQCQGVAWWLATTRAAAEATYPENWKGVLALSRLAIAPSTPSNACTFLLARSRRMIDRNVWPCLVTYADERKGHTGAIYRADNWTYIGKTKPTPAYEINGKLTARKAGPKTRTHTEMLSLGAIFLGSHAKHKFVRIAPTL
jgi:hypothetical protein